MVKNSAHKNNNFLRQFFAFGLLFLFLASSCSIQRGLQTVFNFPAQTAPAVKGAKIAPSTLNTNCTKCADIQILIEDVFQSSPLSKISSAVLLMAVFTLLFGPLLFDQKVKPPHQSPKRIGGIPIYLLYRKLLIYDLR